MWEKGDVGIPEELGVDLWLVGIDIKTNTVKLAIFQGLNESSFIDQSSSVSSARDRTEARG